MIEDAAHVERLLAIDCRLVSLRCGSYHEGVRRCILEVARNLCHIDHTRHVGVTNHALRVMQRISHLPELAFDALVLPYLLEWVVWIENGGRCSGLP